MPRKKSQEPEPIRAFTGWMNGNRNPDLYRACLIRWRWESRWNQWSRPDTCWGVSLCDENAYPHRWYGLIAEHGEYHLPEVAQLEICAACATAREAQKTGARTPRT